MIDRGGGVQEWEDWRKGEGGQEERGREGGVLGIGVSDPNNDLWRFRVHIRLVQEKSP